MTYRTKLITAMTTIAMLAASPALADRDHGDHDKKHPAHAQARHEGHDNGRHLALGHDKNKHRDVERERERDRLHRLRIGDRFAGSGFERVRDPGSLGLERNRRWDYYRKGSTVYRVDNGTHKILAIKDMLNIFGG